jgi:hypothetical protein
MSEGQAIVIKYFFARNSFGPDVESINLKDETLKIQQLSSPKIPNLLAHNQDNLFL